MIYVQNWPDKRTTVCRHHFTKSSKTLFGCLVLPPEVRVRAHYAVRLVTVPMADKKNLNHRPPMPHKATFCRDLRSRQEIHFCRKTRPTRQIAAMWNEKDRPSVPLSRSLKGESCSTERSFITEIRKKACDAVRHRPVCQESCFIFLFRAVTFLFILTY